MSFTIPISRKIKGAVLATLVVLIGEVANQALSLYPHNPFVNELPIILPAITGWLVKEEKADEDISSQINVSPTPVEWAAAAEIPAVPPVSTPVAVPNTVAPVATPGVQIAPVASVTPPEGVADQHVVNPVTGLVN